MSPAEFVAEYTYPLRSISVVFALVTFAFLLALASVRADVTDRDAGS